MNPPTHSGAPLRTDGRAGCLSPPRGPCRRGAPGGFTVVELLVAVAVLTLIVLALYNMFDQTQKALRGNVAQVDVLEGGRAAMELITREVEQMSAGGLPGCTNFYSGLVARPFLQPLLSAHEQRTNVLQELFFVTHFNRQWSGVGYRVVPTNGVGSLYRFVTNVAATNFNARILSASYRAFANTNYPGLFQRVTDGVVHFQVRAFDANGRLLRPGMTNSADVAMIFETDTDPDLVRYLFRAVALPAYLEIELGILEPQVLDQFKSIPNANAALTFLQRQAGRVHLFQQRIPVRAAL